jgi:hypothetical protein
MTQTTGDSIRPDCAPFSDQRTKSTNADGTLLARGSPICKLHIVKSVSAWSVGHHTNYDLSCLLGSEIRFVPRRSYLPIVSLETNQGTKKPPNKTHEWKTISVHQSAGRMHYVTSTDLRHSDLDIFLALLLQVLSVYA